MKLTVSPSLATISGIDIHPGLKVFITNALRPDYKKLGVLRQFFPHVPILALSATCPPKVLQDILKILHMKPVVDGKGKGAIGMVTTTGPTCSSSRSSGRNDLFLRTAV